MNLLCSWCESVAIAELFLLKTFALPFKVFRLFRCEESFRCRKSSLVKAAPPQPEPAAAPAPVEETSEPGTSAANFLEKFLNPSFGKRFLQKNI